MSKNNDNHANQCNPNNSSYQGHTSNYTGTGTRSDLNNHSNQMNPNNYGFTGNKGGNTGNRKWIKMISMKFNFKI